MRFENIFRVALHKVLDLQDRHQADRFFWTELSVVEEKIRLILIENLGESKMPAHVKHFVSKFESNKVSCTHSK